MVWSRVWISALAVISAATLVSCGASSEPPSPEGLGGAEQALGTQNVTTYRNDISRTGAYLAETQLTPANVNGSSFGKLYERAVQGDIYAQPLYLRGVATPAGTKNLTIVGTSTNDVYAFDADNLSTDPYAARIWHRNLNPWRPLAINSEICAETVGSVGITSTPVIDTTTNTMYVVTRRSGGRVVASGGHLYQFHNNGRIWQYTGTPCGGSGCPGWQMLDNNPAAIQIAATSQDLYQIHRTGLIWRYTGTACSGNSCPGWQLLDNNALGIRIEAAGAPGAGKLMQLHEDGSIWTSTGTPCSGSSCPGWQLNDTNVATTQVVVATAPGATTLTYQMHRDGTIWRQTGPGIANWQMLDNNPAGAMIAAAGPDLYQLHNTGKIWKYTGTPCSGTSCPGWQMLDDNPATTRIVASPSGSGSALYQFHTTGLIWQYTGTPCSGTSCPGWQMLDNNGAATQIVADNATNSLYQTHLDGTIWQYTGTPCSGNSCPGWLLLDNNWALNDGANYLHAVNLTDGSERQAPVLISATDPANSSIHFDSRCERNRPGLLLLNSVVYIGYATFSCDAGAPDGTPYHGWVLGYRTSDLAQVATFDTSSDGGGAGVWQSGGGLVGSTNGFIYFETGNDTSPPARLGDSFVRLQITAGAPGLVESGHYTVSNAAALRLSDTDLGSGGPMLLPGGRLIGGGKQGRYYVLNSSTMAMSQNAALGPDGFEGFQAFENTYHSFTHTDYENGETFGPNIHSAPVYFQGTSMVYQMPEKDFLKGFAYNTSTLVVSQAATVVASGSWAKPPDGMPGGASSISANGNVNGIVWTNLPQADGQWVKVTGVLAAFNANTLTQLWADSSPEMYAKFTPPTIADGKVYRATFASAVHYGVPGKLIAYGPLSESLAAAAPTPQTQSVQPLASPDAANRLSPGWQPVGSHTEAAPITDAYWRLGGPQGYLGLPVGEEQPTSDARGGRYRDYVSSPKKTSIVNLTLRGAPVKGPQITLESAIYWSPTTGAHPISGGILTLYRSLGAENSALGYPIQDETNTDDATGRVLHFEHGDIVWHPGTGASVQLFEPASP